MGKIQIVKRKTLPQAKHQNHVSQVFNRYLYVSHLVNFSVPNSSDGLIFVKRRALDGPFLDKNTGFRRALDRL